MAASISSVFPILTRRRFLPRCSTAIGAGIFAGPAVGAASLQFLPHYSNTGVVAVTGLLLVGLAGLLYIWRTHRTR